MQMKQSNGLLIRMTSVCLSLWLIMLACTPKTTVLSPTDTKVKHQDHKDKETTHDPQDGKVSKGIDKDSMKTIQDVYHDKPDHGVQTGLHVGVLLPLVAKDYYPGDKPLTDHTERMLNFYQGMLLGFEQMQAQGFDVYIEAFDTKRDLDRMESILTEVEASKAQMLIGGYQTKNIKALAQWAKEHKTLVISPWRSSSTVTSENPFFVQINPTLDLYLEAITQHLILHFNQDEVILVGKRDDRVLKRIEKIQDLKAEMTPSADQAYKVYVPDNNLEDMEPEDFLPLVSGHRKVFVLPFTSNLDYVSSFISKLTAANPNRTGDIVIGMPNWYSDKNLSYGELIAHNVRIPLLQYVDHTSVAVTAFVKKFYDRYAMIPKHDDAFKGYDIAMYVSRAFRDYGTDMLIQQEGQRIEMSTMSFNMNRHRSATPSGEQYQDIDFFVNRAIEMRAFTDAGCVLIR